MFVFDQFFVLGKKDLERISRSQLFDRAEGTSVKHGAPRGMSGRCLYLVGWKRLDFRFKEPRRIQALRLIGGLHSPVGCVRIRQGPTKSKGGV